MNNTLLYKAFLEAILTFSWLFTTTHLFTELVQLQREIERAPLAVVHGVSPSTAAPLSLRIGPLRLSDRHVAIGAPVRGERHELSHGERVECELKILTCNNKLFVTWLITFELKVYHSDLVAQ